MRKEFKTINLTSLRLGALSIICGLLVCWLFTSCRQPSGEGVDVVLPIQPNEKPIRFKYNERFSGDSSNTVDAHSLVIEGELEDFARKLNFSDQQQIDGRVVTDKKWEGKIDAQLRDKVQQIIVATRLEKVDDTPLPAGRNGAGAELTLFYAGGRMLKGKPLNRQDWESLVRAIQQIAEKDAAADKSAEK